MRLLLTSAGITNPSIEAALTGLLGKPIAESSALVVPTGIYPFPGGADAAGSLVRGLTANPLCGLGWKSLGVLELTALPSVDEDVWVPAVQESDALLVWGGDPLYLSYWMRQSRFADLLPSLRPEVVYVGVSAGAMVASSTFGETYLRPPHGTRTPLTVEDIAFDTPGGELKLTFATAAGVGLVDFALIPHFGEEGHADASLSNAELWAARLGVPTYAIDDRSAIRVVDGTVDVVSDGRWKRFEPGR